MDISSINDKAIIRQALKQVKRGEELAAMALLRTPADHAESVAKVKEGREHAKMLKADAFASGFIAYLEKAKA